MPTRICYSRGPPPSPPRTKISIPGCACAPRVPLPRVASGQQRSLTSPVTQYLQVGISAGQYLDRRPIFQAGVHVWSSSAEVARRASGVEIVSGSGRSRHKSGTNHVTQHQPTPANDNQRFSSSPTISTAKTLVGVLPAALHLQARPVPQHTPLTSINNMFCPDRVVSTGAALRSPGRAW